MSPVSFGLPRSKTHLVAVGRILREWGVKGEVKCLSYNPESTLFAERSVFYRMPEDSVELDQSPQLEKLEVVQAKVHGSHWRMHFAGYDTPEAAKALRGQVLAVPREELPPLAPGETYLIDLLGLEVLSPQEESVGKVLAFQHLGGMEGLVIGRDLAHAAPIPFEEEFMSKVGGTSPKLKLTDLGYELLKINQGS